MITNSPTDQVMWVWKADFFSCWMFFSHGNFVPPDVLSHQTFCRKTFFPSRRFVPPDILSLWMFCPAGCFPPRHFVPPDSFPLDVLSPNVRSPDVVSPNVLSGHRQYINADVQKKMYTCAHMNINHLSKHISLSVIGVRYHSGGSMKLNACILLLAHMVYL